MRNRRNKKRRRRDYDDFDELDDNKNNMNDSNDTTNNLPPEITPKPLLKPLPIPAPYSVTTAAPIGPATDLIPGSATAQILSALHEINQALNDHKQQMQLLSTRIDSISDTIPVSNSNGGNNANNPGVASNIQSNRPSVGSLAGSVVGLNDGDNSDDEYDDYDDEGDEDLDVLDLEIPLPLWVNKLP